MSGKNYNNVILYELWSFASLYFNKVDLLFDTPAARRK